MSLRIKLNNKEVSAEEGDTILNVLEKNGIYVPHVCYNPRLGPIKTCDLCLVEANGKIVRSCETKVEHGMVVSTDNEKVKGVRRKAFDSVLKNHNMYCTFCDNNVDCELHEPCPRRVYTHNISFLSHTSLMTPIRSMFMTLNSAYFAVDVLKPAKT